jgi:hypothetical protein
MTNERIRRATEGRNPDLLDDRERSTVNTIVVVTISSTSTHQPLKVARDPAALHCAAIFGIPDQAL